MTSRASWCGVLTSLVFLSHGAEAGATPPARPMTLDEALAYARSHRPELRTAAARVEEAKARAEVARARWLPAFGATAQLLATTTNNTTGSYVSVPSIDNPRVSATRAASPSTASLFPSASTLLAVGGRQELFDFGQIAAQAAADDLEAEAAKLDAAATLLVLDYDVEEAYFAAFAAGSVLRAAQQAYKRALVHRDLARAGVETGLRRPIELTRAEAALDRYELDQLRAQRGVTAAQVVLAAAIGLAGTRVDAAGVPSQPTELPDLDAALARATEGSPLLRAALARVDAQEQRTRAVAATARPNVFATGALSGNAGGAVPSSGDAAPGVGFAPVVPNWDIGVVLSWPLFDPTISARRDVSARAEDVARGEAEALRERLLADVEQAYADAETARDALPILERTVQAAVANYEQANARFEVGLGNAVELADAEELRTGAEIQLAVGRFGLSRARAALRRLLAEAR